MKDRKKMFFAINPNAGKRQIKDGLLDILDLFIQAGYEPTLYITQKGVDLPGIICEAAGEYALIVCSGGDGTLSQTVDGLLHGKKRPPLGYIPAGTVNDFAVSLGIPREPLEAARAIVQGAPFACDAGIFNDDRYFSYVAAFGAFTEVVYETSQQAKNMLGRAAYILEGLRRVGDIKTYHVRAEYDGTVVEDDIMLGLITSSTSVGGFKTGAGMEVALNDGLMEVLLVKRPQSLADTQTIINSMLRQELDLNFVYSFKTDHLRLHSEVAPPWTLDGEYGGIAGDVSIACAKQAFEVIVPPPAV